MEAEEKLKEENPNDFKICVKCNIKFPATLKYWHKQKAGRYGLRSKCKTCSCNYFKKYRSTPERKEKHRIKMAKWRKENPEKAIEISRKNRKIHGKQHNEKKREKYKTDADYRNKNLERDRKYTSSGRRKELYHNNPKKQEILKTKWIETKNNNYDKTRAKMKKYRDEVWTKKERERRANLSDQYVVMVIKKQQNFQIKTAEIPKGLIELKRKVLKLKRITKTKKP